MSHYSCFSYPRIFEEHRQHFELTLAYHPQPGEGCPARLDQVTSTVLKPADAVLLRLPLAFGLMTAAQLEILISKGFGKFSTSTFPGKRETWTMQIRTGTSYREDIQREELASMNAWCERVIHDLLHQQCQRSPRRHFSMIDQQTK